LGSLVVVRGRVLAEREDVGVPDWPGSQHPEHVVAGGGLHAGELVPLVGWAAPPSREKRSQASDGIANSCSRVYVSTLTMAGGWESHITIIRKVLRVLREYGYPVEK